MSATDFIDKIDSILIQVQKHGGVIENSTIVHKIQATFLRHKDYRATISTSMTTPNQPKSELRKSLLNVDSVLQSSLVLEHSYQPLVDPTQESREEEIARRASRRFPYNCFHCGRSGHRKSECRSRHLPQNPRAKAIGEEDGGVREPQKQSTKKKECSQTKCAQIYLVQSSMLERRKKVEAFEYRNTVPHTQKLEEQETRDEREERKLVLKKEKEQVLFNLTEKVFAKHLLSLYYHL